ncbi:magnesium transporter [Exilibacterium tricleocarpae]|uniref:Magnesium transporter n=1 Tax=Exilibacterium tricleocarpae TaxID=2591008 RepID=A0A545TNJ1_9GAMM|nr:magnesium transporter [Exilibacterium tricleocarpae]TQV78793.1 magnesium transporter [Exilibacterium tricleocarpae]
MTTTSERLTSTAGVLSEAFLLNYPQKAARYMEKIPAAEAASIFQQHPVPSGKAVWVFLSPGAADQILGKMPDKVVAELLAVLDANLGVALLGRLDEARQAQILACAHADIAREMRELLTFPEDTAGRLMQTRVMALNENITVEEAIRQLKAAGRTDTDHLFLLDDNARLTGRLAGNRLALTDKTQRLSHLALPMLLTVHTLDPKDEVVERLEAAKTDAVPVLDSDDNLVGVIKTAALYQDIKEELVTNMQTMVGASKDEKALSSSLFSVRKRLPWLQINLLTAFAAAAVVGAFEGLIAQFTALAILLPVAAGQSGNAGAQALAVTMRGLTLREITTRSWLRILLKEMSTGFINGVAIALTCAVGVWVWSQSLGLALVIALSMVVSLVIAGSAGALVPILLKKLGQDPAQSSSIVLTTVTDIAGFMSFLGIATLLSGMLPQG